jgi:SynChlorMet cassette radical SAM/SPASM protein ScmE
VTVPAPPRPRLWATPRRVDLALTAACNLSCRYCSYQAAPGRRAEDLPIAGWLALIDELGDGGVMRVLLTGGEPLLCRDFAGIVAAVVRNRMRFALTTNGVLLTPQLVRLLKDTGRVDDVQVSMDGGDAWVNDRTRGPGAWDGAIRGLRLLAEHDLPRSVRLTLSRHNADRLESALPLLLELAPIVSTNEVVPLGRGAAAFEDLAMTREQRLRVGALLGDWARRTRGRVTATAGPQALDRSLALLREAAVCETPGDPRAGYLTGCGGVFSDLAVLHDGTIVPCLQLPGLPLGRAGEVAVAEVWLHHPTLAALRERWQTPVSSFAGCAGCTCVAVCRGGCVATALAAFGTIDAPDPTHCLRTFRGDCDGR